MAEVRYKDWAQALPQLPGEQILEGDIPVVIRDDVPYTFKPIARAAYAEFKDNALVTTINTMDVWESINGVLIPSPENVGYSFLSNVFTHEEVDALFPIVITANVTFMKDGGGAAHNYQFGVFRNGGLVGVGQADSASSTGSGCVSVAIPAVPLNGDTFEVKIRNRSGTNNVVVSDMAFFLLN